MKTNIILAIGLLVISALFLITQPGPVQLTPETEKSFLPLLEKFDWTEVSTIKIKHKNQSVTIFRTKDITELTGTQAAGDWVIENAQGHAAKLDTVNEFLMHLKELKRGFVRATDITNLPVFGLAPEDAVAIQLFKTEKTQVKDEKEKDKIKIQIKRIPYYSLLIGLSPTTKDLIGLNDRFIKLGHPKDPLPEIKDDAEMSELFDFETDVLFVKDVNMSKISADLNSWLNLELFRLDDWLENVEEIQMINIVNYEDNARRIILAEREENEVVDKEENPENIETNNKPKPELPWFFFKIETDANNKKYSVPDVKADKTKVRNFLYDLRAFKAMSYRGVIDVDTLRSNDFKGKFIAQAMLVKKISNPLQLKVSDLYQEKNNSQQQLYFAQTPEEFQAIQKRIQEIESEINKLIGGKQLMFYIAEEELGGKIEYWFILDIRTFSKDKKNYFWQYNISEVQMKKLSPEKSSFEIKLEPETQPGIENDDPDDAGLKDDQNKQNENKPENKENPESLTVQPKIIPDTENPQVKLVTNMGEIMLELYEDDASNTVANFIELCEKQFYDNIYFHRVIKDFMIQCGCPNSRGKVDLSSGSGDPGYKFADEFSEKYKFDGKGILAMANSGPDTNGSQFFITHAPTRHLNGKHTIFGSVIAGLDVVDEIATTPTRAQDMNQKPQDSPLTDIYIIKTVILQKRAHEYKVKKLE